MSIKEIKIEDLNVETFVDQKCKALAAEIGDDLAINALSGGVDSSVATMLAHRAIGSRLPPSRRFNQSFYTSLCRGGYPSEILSRRKKRRFQKNKANA